MDSNYLWLIGMDFVCFRNSNVFRFDFKWRLKSIVNCLGTVYQISTIIIHS